MRRTTIILTLAFGVTCVTSGFLMSIAARPRVDWSYMIGAIVFCACVGAAIGGSRGGSKGYVLGVFLGLLWAWGWVLIAIMTRPPRSASPPPAPTGKSFSI